MLELWLEWLADETKLAIGGRKEDRARIEQLFLSAKADYLCTLIPFCRYTVEYATLIEPLLGVKSLLPRE